MLTWNDIWNYIINNPIACSIAIVFTVIIVGATLWFWPPSQKIKRLKEKLKDAKDQLPKTDYRQEFVKNYHKINHHFSREESVFSYLWKEFAEQLIEPQEGSAIEPERTAFQNSCRPQEFFTLEALLRLNDVNLKSIHSAPGILVGLGVLGTFFGLTLSLIFAMPHLSGNENDPSEAVQILISGSGVAFITSLIGLFCSLLFNWCSDKNLSDLQHLVDRFNARLEKSLLFITEEQILGATLKEIAQQGKFLENMDEKIALKIGDMTEQIGQELKDTVSQSNQSISEAFFTDLAEKMTSGIGDFSQKQTETLNQNLSLFQEKLPSLIDRMQESQKQNDQAASDAINNLASIGANNQKYLDDKNKELYSYLEKSQRQSEENIKTVLQNMSSTHQNSQKQLSESIVRTMQSMHADIENVTSNFKKGMSQTLSDSSETLKNLLDISIQINSSILKQTKDIQTAYQKNSSQFINNLNEAITEIKGITSHIRTSVEEFHKASGQQTQIAEKNEHLINSFNVLSKQLINTSSSVSDVLQKIPQFTAQMEASNQSLKEIWSRYESRFAGVDESATILFEKISEGLKSVSDQSAEHIQKLYEQSAGVSNQFAQAVEQLTDEIEDLNSSKNFRQTG